MAGGERSRVDQLRDAVAVRVRATSLRGTAREVGMTAPGITSFIEGTRPHPATLRKVEAWYVRMIAESGAGTRTEDAAAAIFLLARDLPERRQRTAKLETVELYERLYDAAQGRRPTWLRELRRQFAAEDDTHP